MKVFNLSPGQGKTTALLKIMLEPGNEDVYYVAPMHTQADAAHERVTHIAGPDALNVPGRGRFLSASQLRDFKKPKGIKPRFVIDEADGVLGIATPGPILAIALSDDEVRREFRQNRAASA